MCLIKSNKYQLAMVNLNMYVHFVKCIKKSFAHEENKKRYVVREDVKKNIKNTIKLVQ